MATTATGAFSEFSSRLTLTKNQRERIAARRDRVRGIIGTDWSVDTAVFGGSYARGTKVRAPGNRRSDVDVYVVLDGGYRVDYTGGFGKSPPDLLLDIKRTLDKQLKTPAVRRDAPAVRITYTDMIVDVVPAFRRRDGHLDIPHSSGWMLATPEQQARAFAALNAKRALNLKPVIRMAKYWLSLHPSLVMRSYHLETIAYEAFEDRALTSYRKGLRDLFSEAAWRIKYYCDDPGGSGSDVSSYMPSSMRNTGADMFERAAVRATTAINTRTSKAEIDIWRAMLKPRFPAYG